MIESHIPLLIPALFLFASLLTAVIGRRAAYWVALIATGVAFVTSLAGLEKVVREGRWSYHLGGWAPPIGIEYVLDPLSAFVAVVITGVAFPVLLYSKNPTEVEIPHRSGYYYSVCMLFLTGLTGMTVTGDLFNLYVFLEIASLSGYALVAVGEDRSTVAAFRYLLIGTIGASFYLLGLGFVFIMTGTLNMADNARLLSSVYGQPSVIAGVSLMVIGMGIKMALFPLHVWLPDAYTYAPSSSSALLAPIGTKVAAYVVVRILYFVFEDDFVVHTLPLSDIILWTSLIGIVVGSVMAIAQNELKRMLAYSSVAQIGYIGVGIGLANPLGLIGAVLHVLNHAFMKASLFMVAGNLRAAVGHSDITRLNDTLRKSMPWTMAAFTVSALSMVGIPPMAGFFSKWYLVMAAIEKSAWMTLTVILLSSLLTAVYFFRVLEKVYVKSTIRGDVDDIRREVRFSMLLPPVALGFSLIVFGLFNSRIVSGVLMKALPTGW